MIRVENKELLLSREDSRIGAHGDAESVIREFRIPRIQNDGTDLANLTFKVDLLYKDNNTSDVADLVKTVSDNDIDLVWTISETIATHSGAIFINLRAFDATGDVKWRSFRGVVYIEETNGTVTPSTGQLTELEQLEASIDNVLVSEASRVTAENGRVSAESARVTAEEGRSTAETARASAETERASAEALRASAETARASAESDRVTAETTRAIAESARVATETGRASAESARASAESSRVSAEAGRVTAENGRVTAEAGRVSAESARVTEFNAIKSDLIAREQELQGYATEAESYAHGGTNTRTGEDTDNAMYYASNAASSALTASSASETSQAAAATAASLIGIIIPSFTVDYNTGELLYTDYSTLESNVVFAVDTTTGNLNYTITI